MKKIINILFCIILVYFIGININTKVQASTPSGLYITLEPSATEVMPGEDIYVTLYMNNTAALPPGESGVDVLTLYMYYDSSKFSIELLPPVKPGIPDRSVSDNAKILSPEWNKVFRFLDELMIKTNLDNPDYLYIDVTYNYSTRDYIRDGAMFSIIFTAKENATGKAEFSLRSNIENGYGYVTSYPSNYTIIPDYSVSKTEVTITGEPETQYTISFDSAGGSDVAPITAVYGAPISAPTPPTKTGYEFLGWYLGETPYVFTTMPNQDIELVARWKPVDYTIKLDPNGASGSVVSQNTSYDKEITLQPSPYSRPGYTFKGWATTPTGSVVYQDGAKVTNLRSSPGEVTLYAVWEKIEYNLFINSPYITVKRGSTTLTNGSKVYIDDILTITYSRVGYSSAKILVNGVQISGSTYTVGTSDVTIAVTDEVLITYTITYDLDGGVNNPANPTTYDVNSGIITLLPATKAGYNFLGWYTAKSGGTKVETINSASPSNRTLYARWEKIGYNLFINSPYVTVKRGSTTLSNGSKVYVDDVLTITYSRTGYSSAKIYVNGVELTTNTYTVTAVEVVVEISDEVLITYNITYDLDGGVNNPLNPTTYDITSGIITLLPATKDGYNFLGWYTAKSGGTKVDTINSANASNITLYARWQAIYEISLDPQGGLINGSSDIYTFTVLQNNTYGSSLLVPTREGYTFVGWYTDPVNGTRVNPTDKPSSSMTLYARWQVKYSTITFYSNGGTSVPSITDAYGALISEPVAPTKVGHTFLGWYTDNNTFINKQTFPLYMPDGDLKLYAKWEVNSYTINFESNGGSVVSSIVANYGSSITKPTDPTRDGFIFAGWYTDNNTFNNPFNFQTMPANDLTLYAKWIRLYEISFDSQGGTSLDSRLVQENSQIGNLPTPTKVGYTFLGWYTEPNGAGVKITATTVYNFGSDITLYAHYDAISYTITFNSNGGSAISSITAKYDELISWPNDPTRIGYRFLGWFKDNNTFLIPFTPIARMPNENITLYAKWEIRSDITISFVVNGGIELDPLENLTYNANITLPTPTRSGYKFGGWYMDSSLTIAFTSTKVPAEDTVLYAKWIKEYQIIFETNTNEVFPSLIRYENEKYGTLPTPTKVGHIFAGWYTSSTFDEASKVDSNMVVTSSVTLYAKFNVLQYTITFNANGGTLTSPSQVTYNYGETINAPSNPTRTGFIFAGWYTDVSLTTEFIFNTMPAQNIQLYAKWVAENSVLYTIYLHNYDNNGGVLTITRYGSSTYSFPVEVIIGYRLVGWYKDSNYSENSLVKTDDLVSGTETEIHLYAKWEIKEVTLTLIVDGLEYFVIVNKYNTNITTPTAPTKTGYTFVGWFKSNDGGATFGEEFIFNKMPSDDLTIYAKFEANTYTITFDTDGGLSILPITRAYLSSVVLPTPTKEGYKFLGWYDESDNLVSSPYTVTNDITLKAKWEIIGYNDTTLDKIEFLDINNQIIKVISNIGSKVTVYIPYQYEFVRLNVVPLYGITTVTYETEHNLLEGIEVVVLIEVVALSGDTKEYEVTIIRDTNPVLSDLTLNNGLTINFNGSFNYNVTAPINVTNVEITAIVLNSKNIININGQNVTLVDGSAKRVISLNAAGTNTIIRVKVTSLSGEVSNEYVVTIYRSSLSNDASITALNIFGNNSYANELKQKGSDLPSFDKNVYEYYIYVEYSDTSLIINPTYAPGATGIITGNTNLQVGSNIVTIVVTASDGITKKTYTIEVIRNAPSSSAEITEVRLKNIETNKIEYVTDVELGKINVINVPYEYRKINIIPIKSESSANATVIDLGNLDLVEGNNDFVIRITAEDGVTTNEYQIRVVRAYGNTDNTLAFLSIGGLTLTPTLNLDTIFSYSLTSPLSFSTYNLLVEVEKKSPEFGYVTIKYDSATPVKANSLYIYPVVGISTIEIVVYPQKGEAKTYTITIEKENISGLYELSNLVIKDSKNNILPLNPNFNMQLLNYDLGSVSYSIDELKIIASPVIGSKIDSVLINGNSTSLVGNEYIGQINVGPNEITITVSSTVNPLQSKTYKVVVYREMGEDINTANITSSVGYMEKVGNDYSLTLPKSATGFILNVIKDSAKSKVLIDGVEATSKYIDFTGKTNATYTVEVISEIGNKNTYTVTVKRSLLSDSTKINYLTITGSKSGQTVNVSTFPASFTVPYIDDSVTFNPTFVEAGASLSIYSANLIVGLNQIVITVIAEDGITTENYVVKINREAPSSIALLENIIITRGDNEFIQYSLNEIFTESNFNYTSNVEFLANIVKIRPIPYSGYAINFVIRTESGEIVSEDAELVIGENKFIIEVISESNTSNFYYLTITREEGDGNTELEYLTLTDQVIDYDKNVLVYPSIGYFDYSYDYDYIFIKAKTLRSTSKITLQINSNVYNFTNTVDYRIDLKTGITTIRVIVTAENGSEVSYRINVRKASTTSEIDIFDLIVSGLNQNNQEVIDFDLLDNLNNKISFDKNTLSYYVVVPYAYKKVVIKPQVVNSIYEPTDLVVNVVPGEVVRVDIKVNSPDGLNFTVYTVYIKGERGDSNTSLEFLEILDDSNKNYIVDFDESKYVYDISVPKSLRTLKIFATPASTKSNIIIGDKTMKPYPTNEIDITEEVDIYVWVIAEDGSSRPYVVRVRKSAKSDNAYLESITITDNHGNDITSDLIPRFTPTKLSYQIVVEYNVTGLSISGVGVDGARIISNASISNLEVLPKTNVLEVISEASDGSTIKYTFVIFRLLPMQDASLLSIQLGDKVIDIVEGVYDYNESVSFLDQKLPLVITPNSRISRILVNDKDYVDGFELELELGLNEIEIEVIAEDGITTSTYKVSITREEPNRSAYIEDLDIVNCDAKFLEKLLDGKYVETYYDPYRFIQYIEVDQYQSTIVLRPKLSKNSCIKDYEDVEIEATLEVGYNIIPLTVVAEDGVTENNYFFIVKRNAYSNNTKIKNLTVNNSLQITKLNDNIYKVKSRFLVDHLDLNIELEDENATYEVLGNEKINGNGVVTILVTAEDGQTVTTYYITVEQDSTLLLLIVYTILFAIIIPAVGTVVTNIIEKRSYILIK